jgi:hypothetical protein
VGTVVNPAFLTASNFSGIGQQVSALGVTVVGESLILLIAGMDLSLEGTYGLAPTVAAWLMVPALEYGSGAMLSPYLAILVLLAVGAFIGLVNGLLIVKGRLNGFIVTLGMTIVLAGLQQGIVKGNTLFNLPSAFNYLGAKEYGQVPLSLIVAAIIFIGTGLFLRYHRAGRAIYAVGGNRGAGFFRAAGDVDTMAAVLTLDDDSLAVVSGTRYNAAGYDVRLEVLGSRDSVCAGLSGRLPLRSADPGVTFPPGPPYSHFTERFADAYRAELVAFVDLAAHGGQSPCTMGDALEAFCVAEACELSRARHEPVAVAEVRP